MGVKQDLLAFDFKSVRSFDEAGRLHIEVANISKANICPYYGQEIPGWQLMGLEPTKIYKLFRDPAELEAGAKTFNNLPILSMHVPHSADDHRPDEVVGTTGSDTVFEQPYLRTSLAFWKQGAIEDIQTGKARQLSSSYAYTPEMTPGEYLGERFDGRMTNIRGNHVALVPTGRAGNDVMVGDEDPFQLEKATMPKRVLSRKAALVKGALAAYAKPKLAADASIDLTKLVSDINTKSWRTLKPKLKDRLLSATQGKLAADASLDDFAAFLAAFDAEMDDESTSDESEEDRKKSASDADKDDDKKKKTDDDDDDDDDKKKKADDEEKEAAKIKAAADAEVMNGVRKYLMDCGMSEDETGNVMKMIDPNPAKDEPPSFPGKPTTGAKDKDMPTKEAMDSAIATATAKTRIETENAVIARLRAVRDAENAVEPYIGKLKLAMDSAAAVYKLAFDHLKVDVTGVDASAYPTILKLVPRPDAKKASIELAQDRAITPGFATRYPDAARVRHV